MHGQRPLVLNSEHGDITRIKNSEKLPGPKCSHKVPLILALTFVLHGWSFSPAYLTAVTLISTRSPGARLVPTQARHGQPSLGIHSHQTASISAFLDMSVR